MSPRNESALRAIIIGIGVTIGAAIMTAAYNTKEDVSAHALDQERTDKNMQRVLDLLCSDHPTNRQCR